MVMKWTGKAVSDLAWLYDLVSPFQERDLLAGIVSA